MTAGTPTADGGASTARPAGSTARRRLWTGSCLVLILAASLVPRLPVLYSAPAPFNSDEAVNALVVKHLLERGEFVLHNWDAHYYGIVEGLLAIPFVWIDGYTPLAFKLSAVAGFLFLVWATYWLGRRLYGAAAGLLAAALLTAFSPMLVLWSTLASGGYTLVIGWGTLTLALLEGLRRRPPPLPRRRLLVFGAVVGFGLYIYELYLIYALVLAVYAAVVSVPWRALLAPSRAERAAVLRRVPAQLKGAAALLAGFVLGWAPRLVAMAAGPTAGKKPFYELAGPAQMAGNLRLLFGRCIPAFFGVNPEGSEEVAQWTGQPFPLSGALGVVLLAFLAAVYLWALRRVLPRLRGVFGRPPAELDVECLLVLLVPFTALVFLLSPNPQDTLSNRYLLPWLSALPVLAAALLVRMGRASPLTAALAGLFLIGFPSVQIARAHVRHGYLDPELRLARRHEPLLDVVRHLQRQGVRGAWGSYWIAYEATFLSGESVVVAPLLDWDRYPAYSRRVQAMPDAAYVFSRSPDAAHERFRDLLGRGGAPYDVAEIGPYLVYTSRSGRRLIPAYALTPPRPLERPGARIAARAVPAEARAGAVVAIPLTVTNTGSEPWSAGGVGTGVYRVAASYRWLEEDGAPASSSEPRRTLLPNDVRPGGAVGLSVDVEVPARPGSYRLVLTMVQEGVTWFDQAGAGAEVHPVRVVP